MRIVQLYCDEVLLIYIKLTSESCLPRFSIKSIVAVASALQLDLNFYASDQFTRDSSSGRQYDKLACL